MKARFEERRHVARRICIEGTLVLQSPAHLGGADSDASSDQPLVRDAEGRPYLPGTTLAGLLRSVGAEAPGDRLLFGTHWDAVGESEGENQSLLIVDDAPIAGGDGQIAGEKVIPTELRDGVRIDAKHGIADHMTKYDVELLPVGTHFSLKIELALPSAEGSPAAPESAVLLAGVARRLRALELGDISLGARSRRGFGRASVEPDRNGMRWLVTEYAISERRGMLAWLARGREAALGTDWPEPDVKKQYKDAIELAADWRCAIPAAVESEAFHVNLSLKVDGSLLVRSGGHDAGEPDAVHLARQELTGPQDQHAPILPGTSLAGVLRHRCLRIANVIAGTSARTGRAAQLVEGMFGSASRASRVRVPEVVISGGKILRHTRVRIDPWTGGALDGALFTEDALYGGEFEIRLSLDPPPSEQRNRVGAERALLLLALRDLVTGDLAIGGESGAGRGRLRLANGAFDTKHPHATLHFKEDGAAVVTPEGAFDEDFRTLREHLEVPSEAR